MAKELILVGDRVKVWDDAGTQSKPLPPEDIILERIGDEIIIRDVSLSTDQIIMRDTYSNIALTGVLPVPGDVETWMLKAHEYFLVDNHLKSVL